MNILNTFDEHLLAEILSNLDNDYKDNFDFYRFGEQATEPISLKSKIKNYIIKRWNLQKASYKAGNYCYQFKSLTPYVNGFRKLYTILQDVESKKLLIKLIAYRILGYEKVKLPLNTSNYWIDLAKIKQLRNSKNTLTACFIDNQRLNLYYYNLNKIGIPIYMYYNDEGIYSNIYIKQYEYKSSDVLIKPEEGDIVIDCGAFWGDNALFFANEIGETGHVYSFEFIPSNSDIFNTNINQNELLKKRITLVQHPVYETSGKVLFYLDNGPGSRVSTNKIVEDNDNTVTTLSIDDFVTKQKLQKVNFIKMDIEGAEMPALQGAIQTISKFRPKLAISIYHGLDDFVQIPEYLHSLQLGYSFYLKHGTIHLEETVLLAIAK